MAVRQLAGHTVGFQRTLAAHQVARLFGGGAGAGGLGGFFQNRLGNGGVFLKEFGQGVVDHAVDQALDKGVAQLCLGLPLKLRFLQLDADNGDHALARVGAGQVLVLVLQDAVGAGVLVQNAGQRQLKAVLMGAALGRVDVVGKAQQQLVVAVVVVLQGNLCHGALPLALHIQNLRVQGGQVAALAQVADKGADTALIAHRFGAQLIGLFFLRSVVGGALIGQGDSDTGVQERFLAQALEQRFVVILCRFYEHFRVGLEGDRRAGGGCRPQPL